MEQEQRAEHALTMRPGQSLFLFHGPCSIRLWPMLRKSKKRKSFKPRIHVGCPFCHQLVAQPNRVDAYTVEGAWGGRCDCGAWYVADVTGKLGGDALLDLTTLACRGDTAQALALRSGVDYELEAKPLNERDPRQAQRGGRVRGGPKVWFLKLRPAR